MIRKHLFALCFSAALIAFTVYISLDTFVLNSAFDADASRINTSMFPDLQSAENSDGTGKISLSQSGDSEETGDILPFQTGNADESGTGDTAGSQQEQSGSLLLTGKNSTSLTASNDADYQDEHISVTLTTYRAYDTEIYVADVTVTSAYYLKTAFASDTYGKNITAKTSVTAAAKNAVLAINGDYYGVQESGYVIRNGIVYRGTAKGSDVLCIFTDGTMQVVNDRAYTADELVAMGVWQAFTFGPSLLEDGTVTVDENDEVGRAKASNPRTAIGMIDANHFVFVVSDGRTSESAGLSLYQLAVFMEDLGVKTAYNLDGGGSSTLYFNGQIINKPTSSGRIKEREVSDIVYIG